MAKRKKKRWTATDANKAGKGGATMPPICKLCGAPHWGRDPHKYKKPVPQVGKITLDKCKVKT